MTPLSRRALRGFVTLGVALLLSSTTRAQAPALSIDHSPVPRVARGEPTFIRARVVHPKGRAVKEMAVYLRLPGFSSFSRLPMKPEGGLQDVFVAEIAGSMATADFDYYLEALEARGSGVARAGSSETPFHVFVGTAPAASTAPVIAPPPSPAPVTAPPPTVPAALPAAPLPASAATPAPTAPSDAPAAVSVLPPPSASALAPPPSAGPAPSPLPPPGPVATSSPAVPEPQAPPVLPPPPPPPAPEVAPPPGPQAMVVTPAPATEKKPEGEASVAAKKKAAKAKKSSAKRSSFLLGGGARLSVVTDTDARWVPGFEALVGFDSGTLYNAVMLLVVPGDDLAFGAGVRFSGGPRAGPLRFEFGVDLDVLKVNREVNDVVIELSANVLGLSFRTPGLLVHARLLSLGLVWAPLEVLRPSVGSGLVIAWD
ncbi:MAG: hypothetical protein HY901_10465 [Deltaproteobacteria bacterium]|nr:hypothetical protein [Deltaproteobacteria bacterium]